MQVIVEIDDNLYTRLFDNGDEYVADMRRACVAIRKGTPLPKGHGRLIDAEELMCVADSDYYDGEYHAVSIKEIKYAKTIIPATEDEE